MDLYMAGSTFEELNGWMQAKGYDKLFSQINDRKEIDGWVQYKREHHTDSKLFIDSGAFSVHTFEANYRNALEKAKQTGKKVAIKKLPYTRDDGSLNVDAYIDYINEIEPYVTVFVQVDHIPGVWGRPRTSQELAEAPGKSWENYLYMRERVTNPDKLLPVFHQGEDYKWLRNMLEFRDKDGRQIPYICISTNKDKNITIQEEWLHEVFDIISKSSNPNIKTHALGLTSLRVLKMFPITSADSTSWLRTATTGSIYSDFGMMCVSKETKHRLDNYEHYLPAKKEAIKKYVEENGFKIEDLIENYRDREMWNVYYLQKWAREYKYEPRNLNKNKLFEL